MKIHSNYCSLRPRDGCYKAYEVTTGVALLPASAALAVKPLYAIRVKVKDNAKVL